MSDQFTTHFGCPICEQQVPKIQLIQTLHTAVVIAEPCGHSFRGEDNWHVSYDSLGYSFSQGKIPEFFTEEQKRRYAKIQ